MKVIKKKKTKTKNHKFPLEVVENILCVQIRTKTTDSNWQVSQADSSCNVERKRTVQQSYIMLG